MKRIIVSVMLWLLMPMMASAELPHSFSLRFLGWDGNLAVFELPDDRPLLQWPWIQEAEYELVTEPPGGTWGEFDGGQLLIRLPKVSAECGDLHHPTAVLKLVDWN